MHSRLAFGQMFMTAVAARRKSDYRSAHLARKTLSESGLFNCKSTWNAQCITASTSRILFSPPKNRWLGGRIKNFASYATFIPSRPGGCKKFSNNMVSVFCQCVLWVCESIYPSHNRNDEAINLKTHRSGNWTKAVGFDGSLDLRTQTHSQSHTRPYIVRERRCWFVSAYIIKSQRKLLFLYPPVWRAAQAISSSRHYETCGWYIFMVSRTKCRNEMARICVI